MTDLLELSDFLDAATCEDVRAELSEASGRAATLLSHDALGSVAERTRKTTRLTVAAETREGIQQLLMRRKVELEEHFAVSLTECEPPQFLRYEPGDFFVPHQDGNTPGVHDESRFRRISVVVFLSTPSVEPAPDTYGGGALVFHGAYNKPTSPLAVNPLPGTLIAFRSETTHEVTAVTHGVRYTIVSWFR